MAVIGTGVATLVTVGAVIIGILGGYWLRSNVAEKALGKAEDVARQVIAEARQTAEARKKELLLEARDEIHKNRQENEREIRDRRREIDRLERRILQKEENLEKKAVNLERKEAGVADKERELNKSRADLQMVLTQQLKEMERISGLTVEEGKTLLLSHVEQQIRHETAVMIRNLESEAKEEADKKAREIVTLAIQKCAADVVSETTVSVIGLPNDEMKGRIIGREGRNIRAFENFTGVDLIIDDTPEAVILSSFDPVRREIARVALENLVADGRIHPARIEEMVEKARRTIEQEMKDTGERAAFDAGVHNLHPELIKLLGRLKYRTSYGQNVLKHSLEVSYLAGVMAAELKVDEIRARRGGLLHDIGKAVDHEIGGPHVAIGTELAKKYNEHPGVINCIEAHHGDVEPICVESILVQVADAISASRPGARRETLEAYSKRLESLENIAESFEGVEKSFAIQAGREIRIIVKPEEIDDLASITMAKGIAQKVEQDMDYPGQIKVVVIRETRAVDYAK